MPLAPPLHRLYLTARDPYSYLIRYLKEALRMSHVVLAPCSERAATLAIIRDDNTQTLLSVNSTTQTRQYILRVIVVFQILDEKGHVILPPQTLSESRVMTVQSNQILGSSNEANLYYQQMHQTIANALMDRISSREVTAQINRSYNS